MLVNAYQEPQKIQTFAGTRLLVETLDIVGSHIFDPVDNRRWTIQSLYAPVFGRALGGIRAKLEDAKGFVSFVNQRDLEVLLGAARPGSWCRWLSSPYMEPGDEEWVGICADEEDLLDDLQERELFLRAQYPQGILFAPLEIDRRVHLEAKYDAEEQLVLLYDADPVTGFFPDLRLETIEGRWIRANRERVRWDRI